jgi:hypothetical protein
MKSLIIVSGLFGIFLASCVTVNQVSNNKNLAAIYNPAATTIHPKVFAYITPENSIDLYTIIFTQRIAIFYS